MRIYGSASTPAVLEVHVLSDLLSAHLTPLWVNIKMDFSSTFLLKLLPRRHEAGSNFSLYENKANDSWSGNLMKIQRSAHLSVERSDYRIEMEMKPKKKRRSKGSLNHREGWNQLQGKEMDWNSSDRDRDPPNRNSFCWFTLIPKTFPSFRLLHRCSI